MCSIIREVLPGVAEIINFIMTAFFIAESLPKQLITEMIMYRKKLSG